MRRILAYFMAFMIFSSIQTVAQTETTPSAEAEPKSSATPQISLAPQSAGLTGKVLENFEVGKMYEAILKYPYAKKIDGDHEVTIYKNTSILIRGKKKEEDKELYYFTPLDRDSERSGNFFKSDELANGVQKKELYYFVLDEKDISKNPKLYFRSYSTISHGTLIVPFKLRTKNGELTGDSTLGYYVGRVFTIQDLDILPIISAGIAPISVAIEENKTETKLGVTGAIGVILRHTGNFQIGIVSGIDHIGGDSGDNWEYEDDVWVSFMIGFNFAN